MKKSLINLSYLLLIPLGLIIYARVLNGPFVFDDHAYIALNPWIKSLSNFIDVKGMRYAGDLSFALTYKLLGLAPFGYHLVNVLIHIVNSIIVFFLCGLILKTPLLKAKFSDERKVVWFSFGVSLIFLCHPIQTQAVAYISQRYTSLAALFYLASCSSYLKARLLRSEDKRHLHWHVLAFISAIFAMKTKEISFTLPFMVMILELSLFSSDISFGKRIKFLAPILLTAIIIPLSLILPDVGITEGGNRAEELFRLRKLNEAASISRYQYFLTETTVIITYLRLMFLPVGQHFNYYYPLAESIWEPVVLSSFIALSLFFITGIYLLLRSEKGWGRIAGLGIVWFFITLSIESSVIPIRDVINEHRMYLPAFGLIIAFFSGVFYLIESAIKRGSRLSAEKTVAIMLVIIAVPLSSAAYMRNTVWGNKFLLYADEVEKNPLSVSPHMNIGVVYYERGQYNGALGHFKEAERINPASVYVHRTLGKFYFHLGDMDKAIEEYRKIITLDADREEYIEARYNLGVLYMKKGSFNMAEEEFRKVLEKNNNDKHAIKALEMISKQKAGKASSAVKESK